MLRAKEARVIAAAAAAAFASLSITVGGPMAFQDGGPWVVLLAGLAAAVASWIVFPGLGRVPGAAGVMKDLGLVVLAVGLAGAMAGTVVLPGFGTVVGVMIAYTMPCASVAVAMIYAIGALVALRLARVELEPHP